MTSLSAAGRPGIPVHDDGGAAFQRTAPPRVVDGCRISTFDSTVHAQGAWRDDELHMAPVSGLVTAEILAHAPRPELRLARLSFEILGLLHYGPLTVSTQTIRPGRTIELIESTVEAQGRSVLIARAWRLLTGDTSEVSATRDPGLTPLAECHSYPDMAQSWPGGFIRSLDIRVADDHRPGDGRCWITSEVEMIAGEPTADLVRLIGMVDTANGVAAFLPTGPGGYTFPNVDLQIHLYREPVGRWLGLATSSHLGTDGIGLTSTVLHDESGPFGHAEQLQTVRRVPVSDA
ncbi:thioesterase family protein [Citricoccus sp. GCM10030269]|uniref:thioesterase family protein n=1 Tax=Citricoccus sp. GCM10030269 TaxID=3273388 RepID=UPI00361AB359